MTNKNLIIGLIIVFVLGTLGYISFREDNSDIVGGSRDEHGCLTAAGYGWNEEVGACVREFELTDNSRRAAQAAVEEVQRSYALTVINVESHECEGCFTVSLEEGESRMPVNVQLTNWQVFEARVVKLYYYNPEKDKDSSGNIMCSREGLVAIEREIKTAPTIEKVIESTINLLMEGNITPQEKTQGITTEYPLAEVTLTNVSLDQNGELSLTFKDPQNKTSGGSCRVGILWFQIEETAKQFSEVKTVRFIPEELFQP